MFYLTRRQTRAAMSAAAGAAVYLAASELGKDRLKMTGLFVLASASMAGMVTARASAKAYSVEQRLTTHVAATAPAVNLVANGGTIGGATTISGQLTATTVNPSGQHRNNLGYTPDSHQSAAGATYSQSYENATTNRLNNLIDAMDLVSARADFLNSQLSGGGVVIN